MNLHDRARGMTLYEILMVLALLSIFAVAASRLFTSTARVMRELPAQDESRMRFDAAMRMLRDDAWRAASAAGEEGAVSLNLPDDVHVRWELDNEGVLLRTSGEGEQRWNVRGVVQGLTADEAIVIVRLDGGDELHMVRAAAVVAEVHQ
jgi:prepilin-type N-terminal cleavage/methylation domain-containing protein